MTSEKTSITDAATSASTFLLNATIPPKADTGSVEGLF